MFVSHDNSNSNKKKFQKPNILRRKPNLINKSPLVRTPNKNVIFESPDVKSLLTSSFMVDQKNSDLNVENVSKCKSSKHFASKTKVQKFNFDNITELENGYKSQTNVNTKSMLYFGNCLSDNMENEDHQSSISVESMLMGDEVRQSVPMFENDLQNKELEDQKPRWCLDFSQDSQKIIIEHYDESQMGNLYLDQKADVVSTMVPLAAVSSLRQEPHMIQGEDYTSIPLTSLTTIPSIHATPKMVMCEDLNSLVSNQNISIVSSTDQELNNVENFTSMATVQKISIEQLTNSPIRFKCDVPNCNKEFMSEPKLRKHKCTHNKDSATKPTRQITVECPVKKIQENGLEEPCGRIFHVREELVKHLNEEHTIEEAVYRCSECGRRFFWASGLRAHARAHAARSGRSLACPWPGCARVFRQPCRLREHARAHTGDKPYPCRHPNCGWSFRTASKLLRHARRHTGERRHACAACGRAFLRREHLRDHAARHHAPHARRAHACPHADCQQSFTNMSSLYMHMKKVHKKEESEPTAVATIVENQESAKVMSENLFMVSLLEPTSPLGGPDEADERGGAGGGACDAGGGACGAGGAGGGAGGRAARTHCTWPLARADHYQPDAYVLEQDVQVEQSEGSESNIYTVRSDLFLHGNVLHSEDSEQLQCADAGALDAALLAAPSAHLAQEELYSDAVDESSFRVFLLSGEELA